MGKNPVSKKVNTLKSKYLGIYLLRKYLGCLEVTFLLLSLGFYVMPTVRISDDGSHLCTPKNSLSSAASPYLFPCTIEYSLIAAAVIYKMCDHVGLDVLPDKKEQLLENEEDAGAESVDCHKVEQTLSGL